MTNHRPLAVTILMWSGHLQYTKIYLYRVTKNGLEVKALTVVAIHDPTESSTQSSFAQSKFQQLCLLNRQFTPHHQMCISCVATKRPFYMQPANRPSVDQPPNRTSIKQEPKHPFSQSALSYLTSYRPTASGHQMRPVHTTTTELLNSPGHQIRLLHAGITTYGHQIGLLCAQQY